MATLCVAIAVVYVPVGASGSRVRVVWHAPFLSGGGYCSEATDIVRSLRRHGEVEVVAVQSGDAINVGYLEGLGREGLGELGSLFQGRPQRGGDQGGNVAATHTVCVCHTEPGAWSAPRPAYETEPCPRVTEACDVVVGRTMFETDRLPRGWAARLAYVDEVWVPTKFGRDTFVAAGVDPAKVRVVAEPVDTDVFFGGDGRRESLQEFFPGVDLGVGGDGGGEGGGASGQAFAFLSVFKWEKRKGWEVLMEAFLSEFAGERAAEVVLVVLTNPYHDEDEDSLEERVNKVRVRVLEGEEASRRDLGWGDLPRILFLSELPAEAVPKLYRAVDAFALATRGEGFGRPIVEAMASELPVITTNWSGPTEFITEDNAYPVRLKGLVPVGDGAFADHLWADPDEVHLRLLMREVFENRPGARAKGRRARQDMTDKYSFETMAKAFEDAFRGALEHVDVSRSPRSGRGDEL